MKERKIATYTTEKYRLQLLELTYSNEEVAKTTYNTYKYQVRLNRKIIDTSIFKYRMQKLFAMYVQNNILQLKIY